MEPFFLDPRLERERDGATGSPAASSMATRVSARSTVTSTCFLKI
jgi:hypothetical protein